MSANIDPHTVEFFDGNEHLHELYHMLVSLAHTWDDLIDKDHEVLEERIHQAFELALCGLPSNPIYAALQEQFIPMWQLIVSNYRIANHYERTHDTHGLEIGHVLRYEAGSLMLYAMMYALGRTRAEELMATLWKTIVVERAQDYMKEHGDE